MSLPTDASGLAAAIAAHDAAVAARGVECWIGGEPTFTRATASDPEWHAGALGPAKGDAARRLWPALAPEGAACLRTVGRQYPGEPHPRWALGLWAWRSGAPVWTGPPDPAIAAAAATGAGAAPAGRRLRDALVAGLRAAGRDVAAVDLPSDAELPWRAVWRTDGGAPPTDPVAQPALARPRLGCTPIPPAGSPDTLAAEGCVLVAMGAVPAAALPGGDAGPEREVDWVELPLCADADAFAALLAAIAGAARTAGCTTLVLGGHPPPVDARVAYTTLTPDPGVCEVNLAPSSDLAGHAARLAATYAAADAVGLQAWRAWYDGQVGDSGGGGHVTFGGATPADSPFFRSPHTLPRLVAFLARHPALSYRFAPTVVGASGQAPRADEGAIDACADLALALAQLAADPSPTPERLWASLGPLLVDRFGNAHRAEICVDKLWNPWMPGRGQLGLVELRSLRMPPTVADAVAVVALLRAVVTLCATQPLPCALPDWGPALHDRFALPWFQDDDLHAVGWELEAAGLGLAPPLWERCTDDGDRLIARVALPGATLELREAREFWPLVGDLSEQHGTSRLVDPSTRRVEWRLTAEGDADPAAWTCSVDGRRAPATREADRAGRTWLVGGIRYRAWMPAVALHPGVAPRSPLPLVLDCGDRRVEVALHHWRPTGDAYPGWPADRADAAARRAERVTVRADDGPAAASVPPPAGAATPHTLDTRWW